MSLSGALYDLMKLDDISKNMISKMTKEEVYKESYEWASKYSQSLKDIIDKDVEYYKGILNIEREQKNPRKDIAKYSDIESLIWYMYDELFNPDVYEWGKVTDPSEISKILKTYMDKYYTEDKDEWFNQVKLLADELGYASNMKEYKKNPDDFKGNVADIATVIRVALTSKSQTPDLYEILKLFGRDRVIKRFEKFY